MNWPARLGILVLGEWHPPIPPSFSEALPLVRVLIGRMGESRRPSWPEVKAQVRGHFSDKVELGGIEPSCGPPGVGPAQGTSSLVSMYSRVTASDPDWPTLDSLSPPRPPSCRPRLRSFCDVEESPECFADDLAGGGVVGGGACFDGGAEFGVEAYAHDFGGAGALRAATAGRSVVMS